MFPQEPNGIDQDFIAAEPISKSKSSEDVIEGDFWPLCLRSVIN